MEVDVLSFCLSWPCPVPQQKSMAGGWRLLFMKNYGGFSEERSSKIVSFWLPSKCLPSRQSTRNLKRKRVQARTSKCQVPCLVGGQPKTHILSYQRTGFHPCFSLYQGSPNGYLLWMDEIHFAPLNETMVETIVRRYLRWGIK